MNGHAARLPHQLQIVVQGQLMHIRVRQQPVRIQSVGEKIRAAVAEFPAEEYLQPQLLPPLLGVEIAFLQHLHLLLPGQLRRSGGIPVEEVIRNHQPRIALLCSRLRHFCAGCSAACTALPGVHMQIIFI